VKGPVISLGGSVFSNDEGVALLKFIERIRKLESYAIVVGGGNIARERISMLRNLKSNEYYLDRMGIQATRLNATTVSLALGNLVDIPSTIDEAVLQMKVYKKVVMGGTEPGHSTDAVSVLLSEALGRDTVVNITNVDGLYDREPNLNNAKIIERTTFESAIKMLTSKKRGAGTNFPIDLLALNIARRSDIKIKIVGFRNLDNVMDAILGRRFTGTVIS
jgi:uridylate kinase